MLFLHFSLNINLLTLMLALFVEHFKSIAYFNCYILSILFLGHIVHNIWDIIDLGHNVYKCNSSNPPQLCHYNCIFACVGYLTQSLILNIIHQHSQVYLCFTNIAFGDSNSAPICASRNRRAYGHYVPSHICPRRYVLNLL